MKIKFLGLLGLLLLITSKIVGQSQDQKNWVGHWKGTVGVGAMQIGLTFHVKEENGALTSTLDVPMQGLKDYKVESTISEGETLQWELGFGASFKGTLVDAKQLQGVWSQSGQEIPCVFYHSLFDRKPQTPQPPYPYEVKLVDFSHPSGKLKLSGTLTYPKSPADKNAWKGDNLKQAAEFSGTAIMRPDTNNPLPPFPIFPASAALVKTNIDTAGVHHQFPVVLLLSGSGPQDRDGTLGAHKPFAVWSHALTQSGFAVLRVDDRGTGKSIGDPNFLAKTNTESYAEDAMAAINFLGGLPMIDTSRVFVIGHSEGAAVALLLSKKRQLSGIVSLAGATGNGIETSVYQIQSEWRKKGYDSTTCLLLSDAQRKLLALAIAKGPVGNAPVEESTKPSVKEKEAFAKEFSAWVKSQNKEFQKAYKLWRSDNAKLAKVYGEPSAEHFLASSYLPLGYNPWTRYFLQYEPQNDFLSLKSCDILMIQGGFDKQVNPGPSRTLAKDMENSGVGVTYIEFPTINHLMQHAKTGDFSEYFDLEETLAVEVYIQTCQWLLNHARLR